MTKRLVFLAALLAFASAAHAAGPSLTVYTRDLGFVRESRTLDGRTGRDTVRLEGISNRLDFSSVRLAPATGQVTRLAYRWDTASGDAFVERSIGQRVRVTSRGDRVVEGLLVSADGSWLVVRGDDGSVATLARAAVEEVRLAKPPGAVSLRPAIEAVLEGAKSATPAELSYLTGGLSWTCEHQLVRTGETTGIWSARVLVENTTGRSFENARLKLVAGEPSRSGGMPQPQPVMMRAMAMSAESDEGMGKLAEASFADYHLYTLQGTATLRDRESQSLVMIEPRPVKLAPRYVYRGGDARGVGIQLEMVNSAKEGAGVPLPAGRVRCFQPDDDKDLQFTGETNIRHGAVDEKVTLDLGYAFDLAAERRMTSDRRVSDREREFGVEIKLRNRKTVAARIVVEESVGGDVTVTEQSAPSTRKDANTLQWTFDLAPGKEAVLTYTARQRW
jgi:hypothetical protein